MFVYLMNEHDFRVMSPVIAAGVLLPRAVEQEFYLSLISYTVQANTTHLWMVSIYK